MPFLTVESKSSGARTALPENRLQFYLFSYPIAELMNHQCDRFIYITVEELDAENLAGRKVADLRHGKPGHNKIMVPASASAAFPSDCSARSSRRVSPSKPPLLSVSSVAQRDALALVPIQALFARKRTRRLAPRREARRVFCYLPSTS